MIVVDYTARIPPDALKASGVVGVCRYISMPIAKTAWKRITQAEYNELVNAGIQVTLNWEYDARDWMGGQADGIRHGQLAVQQARYLGYPTGSVIVGSADFDMTLSEWQSQGKAYATAFATEIRKGGYVAGVYGPIAVLESCARLGTYGFYWQAGMSTAWSNGRNKVTSSLANIIQRGHKLIAGQDTDWNEIIMTEQYPKGSIPSYPDTTGAAALSVLLTRTNYLANVIGIATRFDQLTSLVTSLSAVADKILAAAGNPNNTTVTVDAAAKPLFDDLAAHIEAVHASVRQQALAVKAASDVLNQTEIPA